MTSAILIDDEINALRMLEIEIKSAFPDLEILGMFQNPEEALIEVNRQLPDIVIIDIEMPQMNGIDFVARMKSPQSQVVFVTAYSEYAIKAIKANALDYLLKPIDSEELQTAIRKAHDRLNTSESQLERLIGKMDDKARGIVKIPTSNGFAFLDKKDIIYCQSDSNYTHIYTSEKEYLVSKTLKTIQELLPQDDFLRVHHSFVVNVVHIKEYSRKDGGYVILSNGKSISVSKSKKDLFNS